MRFIANTIRSILGENGDIILTIAFVFGIIAVIGTLNMLSFSLFYKGGGTFGF